MSQVRFKAKASDNKEYDVLAGWDRPLREFFLTVIALEDGGDDDDAGPVAFDQDKNGTAYLRKTLEDLGIEAPQGFWEKVEMREGNIMHHHNNGEWRTL